MNKKGVEMLVMTIGILLIAIASGSALFAFGYRASQGTLLDARVLANELVLTLNAICLNPSDLYTNYKINKKDYIINIEENLVKVRTKDGNTIISKKISEGLCGSIDSSFYDFGAGEIIFSKEKDSVFLYEDFSFSDEEKLLVDRGFIKDNFVWPSENKRITSCFGERAITRGSRFHEGVDIRAGNDPVFAIANGEVSFVDGNSGSLEIDHGKGVSSRYLHLSIIEVKTGDSVKKGERVAISGDEDTLVPHLDFRISVDGVYVDPLVTGVYDPDDFAYKLNEESKIFDSNCHYNIESYTYKDSIERNLVSD